MRNRSRVYYLAVAGALTAVGALPAAVSAQGNPNQFGAQDRADAASQMIVVGVQQGISSLPPTSGQSITYEFNPELDTYVTSERLGPTSFRSPQTIGAGRASLRIATSYFELADTFAPIPYLVNDPPGTPIGVAALGLSANAHVTLVNFAGTYGITERWDVTMNVPVVVVDAHAAQTFTTSQPTGPPQEAPLSGPAVVDGNIPAALDALNQALQPGGGLFLRRESFNALGFDFNQGTHAGVGRISISAKGTLYAGKALQIAVMPEFFFPSPNEDQFAGSSTAAILPRVVGAYRVADPFRIHLDLGYDHDFDTVELRRFVWNVGASVPLTNVTVDFGVGGSRFNQGIQWTPAVAPFTDPAGNPGTIDALGDTRLGANFIDALGGIKVRLAEHTVLSGAVNVPLNNQGFRADAVGTIAVEQYF